MKHTCNVILDVLVALQAPDLQMVQGRIKEVLGVLGNFAERRDPDK